MEHFHNLEAETELRVDVASGDASNEDLKGELVTLTLLEGSAECFGAPLSEKVPYTWGRGSKFAVFTWYGCRIRLVFSKIDPASMVYQSKEVNHMFAYMNTHVQLEARRDHAAGLLAKAAQEGRIDGFGPTYLTPTSSAPQLVASGPRVLVCGPADRGKSTLCYTLVNSAVRLGRAPLFVELDPSLGSVGIPGTLCAAPIDAHTVSVIDEGLDHANAAALMMWFGATTIDAENAALYRAQVSRLALAVDQRLDNDLSVATAGLIINTPGSFAEGLGGARSGSRGGGAGYDSLVHAVKALRVDVVLALDDRLYQQLRTTLGPGATSNATGLEVAVVKLPRSEGVVTREPPLRKALQSRRVRDYFYGPPVPKHSSTMDSSLVLASSSASSGSSSSSVEYAATPSLKPFLLEVPLDKVKLWRWAPAGLTAEASGGLMPVVGTARTAAATAAARQREEGGGMVDDDDDDDMGEAVLERVSLEEVTESAALLHTVAAVLHEPPLLRPAAKKKDPQHDAGSSATSSMSATMAVLGHSLATTAESPGLSGAHKEGQGESDGGAGEGDDDVDEEEADAREGRRLARSNVAGFVVLQRFSGGGGGEEAKKKGPGRLSVLAPCPGKLPSLNLVISNNIKWMEG